MRTYWHADAGSVPRNLGQHGWHGTTVGFDPPRAAAADPDGGDAVGESDQIDRPDLDPADAAGGGGHEGGAGPRPALTAAVVPLSGISHR